jgi:peptidoglycan-N-acetylglucosamine deacetylase
LSLTCCLTFDFDGVSSWIAEGIDDPSALSRGEFGATVGVPRILDLLERYEIPATFFVPGYTAETYPALVEDIAEAGHELGHHGWMHEAPADLSVEEERRALERGSAALERIAGSRPAGYRAPSWRPSRNTIALLLDHGFGYDSSCMANDFEPYYLRVGDECSRERGLQPGTLSELVELPVYWGLDDFPPFEFVAGGNTGGQPPSAVEEIWRDEFAYAYERVPAGVLTITLHPEVSGRGHRILMLERLIRHFREHDGVEFQTAGDFVTAWGAANPLSDWAQRPQIRRGMPAPPTR